MLLARDVLPYDFVEIGQRHYRTTDNEIVLAFLVLATQMFRCAILQSDGITHFLCDTNLLARTVNQLKAALRKHDSQGNTRKTATRTKIENLRTRGKAIVTRDGQRVEHMVKIQLIDILARNDIDLGIPVAIEGIELAKLL